MKITQKVLGIVRRTRLSTQRALSLFGNKTYREVMKERWNPQKGTLVVGGISTRDIAHASKIASGVHWQKLTREIIDDDCWPHQIGRREIRPVMIGIDRLCTLQEIYAQAEGLGLKLVSEETIFYLQPLLKCEPGDKVFFGTPIIQVGFAPFAGFLPRMHKFIPFIWGDSQAQWPPDDPKNRIGWQWDMKHFFPDNPSTMMHTAPYGNSFVMEPPAMWIFDGIDSDHEGIIDLDCYQNDCLALK